MKRSIYNASNSMQKKYHIGKMASSFKVVIPSKIIIFFFILFSSATGAKASFASKPFKKIYAFGDSYTDTGNTKSSTGPYFYRHVSNPPYGQTFFRHPTNRYSDGRLIIDFVAQALSLPYLPPYLNPKADKSYGINFAVAGATAIRNSFFVKNNLTLNTNPKLESLQTQLTRFNKFLKSKGCKGPTTPMACNTVFDDALFWLGEIGANDYSNSFGSLVSTKTIRDLSTASVTAFLKKLLSKGAKYVVVQGLPPSGCLTVFLSLAQDDDRDAMGCAASFNTNSYNHNTILQTKLAQLRKQFPHAVIVYADYWNSYISVMKNAKKYGIKEIFKACCGSGGGLYNFDIFNTCGSPSSSTSCPNPSQYINWDGSHLTEAMHKALTDSFINGTYSHPPFKHMIKIGNQ